MNQSQPPVTFDSSLPLAVAVVARELTDVTPTDIRFVRDMVGQLHVIVPATVSDEALQRVNDALLDDVAPFVPGHHPARRITDTLAGESLLDEPTVISFVGDFAAHVVERRAIGQDWVLQPISQAGTHPPRFVFFSLKGGVGRSTSLSLWARHLTRQGKSVMVIDLDLEAPGLGAQLLEPGLRPAYGVADWLVQDLVTSDSAALIDQMVAESPIADAGLLVVPAFGESTDRHPDSVIAKLARAYLEKETPAGTLSFASRLAAMVQALEVRFRPDVVLIDSRAGLHETSAASLLHLDAEVLCFAVDLPVTWQGYRYLFGHLKQLAQSAASADGLPPSADWRERFKMVQARASLEAVPHFAANAFSLWTDTLYDTLDADESDEQLFTYGEQDIEAPHYPLSIMRSDLFERFDPLIDIARVGEPAIQACFGELFDGLQQRLEWQ